VQHATARYGRQRVDCQAEHAGCAVEQQARRIDGDADVVVNVAWIGVRRLPRRALKIGLAFHGPWTSRQELFARYCRERLDDIRRLQIRRHLDFFRIETAARRQIEI
jgi:hypothetical protein